MESDTLELESPAKLEETSLKLLDRLGYTVESSHVSGKNVCFKAKSFHGGIEESTLVCVYAKKTMVGEKSVAEIMDRILKDNFGRALVLSASDFTAGAVSFAQDKPVDLIDSRQFKRLLVKHGLLEGELEAEKRNFIYKHAFTAGLTEEEAGEYFESVKKKNPPLIGRARETVSRVELRYAPLAKVSAPLNGEVRVFYVNLNTGGLVYFRRDILKKNTVVEEADFIRAINDLEAGQIRMLGEVVRAEQARFSMIGADGAYSDVMKGGILFELKTRRLVGVTKERNPLVTSNMSLPRLSDDRFNLEERYDMTDGMESIHESDRIEYPVDDVAEKTGLFFGGNTVIEEVAYMPYYRCSFVDGQSRVRFGVHPALREKTST